MKDSVSGELEITTTKDQDPVVGGKVPIIGVDMWEHAYYIQVSRRMRWVVEFKEDWWLMWTVGV